MSNRFWVNLLVDILTTIRTPNGGDLINFLPESLGWKCRKNLDARRVLTEYPDLNAGENRSLSAWEWKKFRKRFRSTFQRIENKNE